MTEKPKKFWLNRDEAVLLVIDVQERLAPAMVPETFRRLCRTIDLLIQGSGHLGVPVVGTEQYPRGLGRTVPELAAVDRWKVIEKMSFGCTGEPKFLDHLGELGRSQVLVTGMEAHVCVFQTVLGLLEAGYTVHLVRDAVISRHASDYTNALESAARAGAVVTTAETALFQMLRTAEAPEFKAVSALIKERDHR